MRVVVTGMGVVSPVGAGITPFRGALCRGQSGIRPLTRFDTAGFKFTRAGEVVDFSLPESLAADWGGADPALQFMLAAADEAGRAARLDAGPAAPGMTGVVLATNFGEILTRESFLTQHAGGEESTARPEAAARSFQATADSVAKALRLRGPRAVLSLSCTSGTAAIGYGGGLIRSGRADAVLVGGYDAISRFAWSGLSALHTMTSDEIRPFDKGRAGTIFGEGAGALVLESLESARRRNAPVQAELLGYEMNNNAHHMTAPAKRGAGSARAMSGALANAGIHPDEVDHVNTHGTGTKYNDLTETQAIKDVFGEHAYAMPITSIKAMTGHLMGAAGAVEAIAAILSIVHGVIPPTINYREADPDCDLDVVTHTKREARIETVLSNSAGIGGCNAAVVFRKAGSDE